MDGGGADRDLSSNQKGAIAEAEIVAAAVRLGIEVYRPVQEHGRFDLVFGIEDRLLRIQCKWAPRTGDVISIRTSAVVRGTETSIGPTQSAK